MLRARLSSSRGRFAMTLVFVALALWATKHVIHLLQMGSVGDYLYGNWIYIFSFIMIVLALLLAHRERPRGEDTPLTRGQDHITVVVPAYNEDPAALKACLESLVVQTRPVQAIYLVDDGSTTSEYPEVKAWFVPFALAHNIEPYWIRQENAGKRHAQSVAFGQAVFADIFVTVDSDSILDEHAIEELIKPFDDETVQSVAGVVLAKNNRSNILARITDLLFVTGQLVDRSMMSTLGSVLVNSGGLAAYRAAVVRDNLDSYLHETFFGHSVEFSDDSMLTLYALQRGKTVQQPTAFVFTMMPDRISHHLRQQVRWMKGSFIRSWWRLKYLPLNSFGFARQAVGWSQFVMTTTFLGLLIFATPYLNPQLFIYILIAPILLGYAQALRYFSIHRSDESFGSQLLTYLMTPLAILWSYFVLRPIRLYASVTCLNIQWGTRKEVEVTLEGAQRRTFASYLPRITIALETDYQRLGRSLSRARVSRDEAIMIWNDYYEMLSDTERQKLWASYHETEKRQARRESMGYFYLLKRPLVGRAFA